MPKKLNLLNNRFGRLLVIEEAPNQGKKTMWKCLCDCGKECIVPTDSLRTGNTSSCGCLRKDLAKEQSKKNIKSLLGKKFGKLIVVQQAQSYRNHSAWLCECECGNQVIVNSVELNRGDTLSCGCLKSSYGEKIIENILKSNNIKYIKEFSFVDLVSEKNVPLRFDFAILNDDDTVQMLIEYDGEQHYLNKTNTFWKNDSLAQRQSRDNQKNNYCLENNIPLIRIPYWEKNNITYDLLMKSNKYLII